MITKDKKDELIDQFRTHPTDTGSPEVQVAILTTRINELTQHMRARRHAFHTQRGLLMLVGQRRRLLAYLNKHNVDRYRTLIARLGLRR